MLSSFTRPSQGRVHTDQENSPFATPYTALLSSPIAARRRSLEELRRPAADLDYDVTPGLDSKIDEDRYDEVDEQAQEHEDDEDDALDEDMDEDGDEGGTPLLPIFSAAHLGNT
jgi:hypothetical protein